MSKLINGRALAANVNTKEISQGINAFGQSLAKQWDILTDLAGATFLHYVAQEQVVLGNKGDTSLLTNLLDVLADGNGSMQKAYQRAASSIVGVDLYLKDGGDNHVYAVAELTKASRGEVSKNFNEKFDDFIKQGIKELAPKKKARKASTSSANPAIAPSEVASISPAIKVAEETGLLQAIASFESAEEQELLKEVGEVLAQLLEGVRTTSNTVGAKDQLAKALKVVKGFGIKLPKAS